MLGVLRVTQRALDDPLTKAEQEHLEMIASQVVLALERARLTEEANQARTMAEAERMKGGLLVIGLARSAHAAGGDQRRSDKSAR